MTQPGWYPDQNGGSGKKYWDGQAWHDAIPAAPPAPRANQTAPARNPTSASKKNLWWLAVLPIAAYLMVDGWSRMDHRSASQPNISAPKVEAPAVQFPGVPVAGQSQDAALGSGLMINVEQFQLDGRVTKATAWIKVGNLTQMSDGVLPASGTYYALGVAVSAVSGTVSVNPFYFAARTANGINLIPTAAAVDNILPATELPQGQKVAGFLGFDVPAGQSIKEIIYQDPGGSQLGRWLVS